MKRAILWFLLCHGCLLLAPGLPGADQAAQSPAPLGPTAAGMREETTAADVVVWNRTLVTMRSPLGFPSVEARAKAASGRIAQVLDELDARTLVLRETQSGNLNGVMVLGGYNMLLTIVEEDLDAQSGETLDAVAQRTRQRLEQLLHDYAAQHSVPRLLRAIGEVAVGTVVFGFAWMVALHARRRVIRKYVEVTRRPGVRLQLLGYDVRPALGGVVVFLARVLVFVCILGLAYLWLAFVLSRFPYTRPWAEELEEILFDAMARLALGAVHEIPNLIALVIIYLLTRGVTRVLVSWFSAIESGRHFMQWLDPEAARATRRLVVIAIWLFALTIAFPYLPGSNSEAFKGVSVFVGLMVSLGGAGFVGQIIGGLAAVYSRAVRTGDYVAIANTEGVVKELGVLSTKLLTRNHVEVTIPNSMLMGSTIHNHSRGGVDTIAVSTAVTIGYDTPWRQVEAMLILAAARTEGLLRFPEPRVLQTALDDFYVRYELAGFAEKTSARPEVVARLHGHIQDIFNENGVQIMSPHFRNQPAAAVTVPKDKWFAPPAKPA